MIPDKTLQEIQERLDAAEVIGGYISLKKAGKNFKALCPFHPEKTPSFMVYPHKQFFICYGCGAGGDLISFVMRYEHVEFAEAVQILAQKAGVQIADAGGGRKVQPELYRTHEMAAKFYHELLMKSPDAEKARAYLKKRGLEPATWEAFQLGYAPERWDELLTQAKQEGFAPEVMERSGLAIPREGKNGWYDRFRNRVIFPIWDARGRVIGFGGRVFEEESGPKYMNSPETDLYVKGKILYGLHLAAPQIREKDFCIVVEGYMDLVSPYQHGIRNVVASMGTSLTEQQVQLIKRYTHHVVIVYDGDYAGEMATLRGLDLFLAGGMRVKVAAVPGGLDPDSMIKTQGVDAFAKVIQQSQDLFDYKLNLLKRRFDPRQTEGRVQICEEMLPTIKRVPHAVQKGEYIKRLSELLGVAEDLLWSDLNKVKQDASWRPAAVAAPMATVSMTAEDLLAGLLLESPVRIGQIADRLDLNKIQDSDIRQMVTWLKEQWGRGVVPTEHRALLSQLPRGSGEWEGRCARWLAWVDTVEEKEKTLEEVLGKIDERQRRSFLESLRLSIRQAEETGDEKRASELIVEYSRFMKTNLTAPVGQ